ncbi:hypothetical protein [Zavarzinia sp.]|uniref:hypothetical protein n=1 Tax=Zavarzinia sp. TaxID=2027920 RepID=UPI0035621F9A
MASQMELSVRALGHRDGRYLLLSGAGEMRQMTAGRICSASGLLDLFAGRIGELETRFPSSQTKAPFDAMAAGSHLIRQCVERGLVDMPRRSRRGR